MRPSDAEMIINYFLQADNEYLQRLGVDRNKLPGPDEWKAILNDEIEKPVNKKKLFYVIWEINNVPVGHSHIANIIYGREAYMHLHLWDSGNREKGNGTYLISESIRLYFDKFNLKELYCEPHAKNPAPNRTLAKAGFELIKTYETTPGWINYHQTVNRWLLTKKHFEQNKRA